MAPRKMLEPGPCFSNSGFGFWLIPVLDGEVEFEVIKKPYDTKADTAG